MNLKKPLQQHSNEERDAKCEGDLKKVVVFDF